MSRRVYVVTGRELGWDCIVGAFDPQEVTIEELEKRFPKKGYIIFVRTVETNLEDYD